MLIVKLADMTIANEKMQYELNEKQLTIEALNGKTTAMEEEIAALKVHYCI